jgi:hypothetical protein
MSKHTFHPIQVAYFASVALAELTAAELQPLERDFEALLDAHLNALGMGYMFDDVDQDAERAETAAFFAAYAAANPAQDAKRKAAIDADNKAQDAKRAAEIALVEWSCGVARKAARTRYERESIDVCEGLKAQPWRRSAQWKILVETACRLAA